MQKEYGYVLPVVLYGCETWSLTLREEHRLRVFENRVLRIFGSKREEMTGGWRKLHNEELYKLYSSPSIIRMIKSRTMRLAGHVARMGRRMHMHWWEIQKGREHWEDQDVGGWTIIKWILEIGLDGMDWIDLAQDRDQWRALVYAVMNLRVS
jgi:hypothetical protein